MATNTKTQNISRSDTDGINSATQEMVEVLYQKLGDRWFAFSLIDNEVFVGSITQEEVDEFEAKARAYKFIGNS